MKRVFSVVLMLMLWLSFVPAAAADGVSNLVVPCKESTAFLQRAQNAAPGSAADRFKKIIDADMYCGKDDGLPRLIADGRLSRAGDFIIPGILFLYLTGWLGWAGRIYLNAVKKSENPEYKEIMIDVPLAIRCFATALLWPLQAVKETLTGEMQQKDENVPVSVR
jgi:photosystem I subunit 3